MADNLAGAGDVHCWAAACRLCCWRWCSACSSLASRSSSNSAAQSRDLIAACSSELSLESALSSDALSFGSSSLPLSSSSERFSQSITDFRTSFAAGFAASAATGLSSSPDDDEPELMLFQSIAVLTVVALLAMAGTVTATSMPAATAASTTGGLIGSS